MLFQEVDVDEVLMHKDVHHRQFQRGIGTGLDGNPEVCLGGELRVDGVDDDEHRPPFLRLADEVPIVNLSVGDVVRPDEEVLRILEIARFIENPVAEIAEHAVDSASVRLVACNLDHRGVDLVEQHVVHRGCDAADCPHIARPAGVGECLLAVFGLDGLPRIGHLLDCFLPGDPLPFAGASVSDSLHGIPDAILPVDIADLAQALEADAVDAPIREGCPTPARGLNNPVVAYVDVNLARARAIAPAAAMENLFLRIHRLAVRVHISEGDTAQTQGQNPSRNHGSCRDSGRLEKTPSCDAFEGFLRFLHSSSYSPLTTVVPRNLLPDSPIRKPAHRGARKRL